MNKCKNCFYCSDDNASCDFYKDQVDPESNACLHFEFKEKDDSTKFDR